MRLKNTDLLRYALWLGVVGTANANRKHYGLPTTWAIHLTLNSVFLFMPELYRGASSFLRLDARARTQRDFITAAHGMVQDAVIENPNYALYVAPVALAYMVSHPQFNIYKGDLAKLRLFGFGLDALPHSATAFAFTNLVMDALRALRKHSPVNAKWYPLAARADQHSALVAGSVLASASALYESGEYAIHAEELRETNGDESKINLVWSAQDTLFDLLANTLGWLAAIVLRTRRRRVKARAAE
ncbi:MAG: hypothetical protein HY741_12670 [Chloroflexi bacterium]|nr:hypothetical protein [Chloroflexota bacterium]